MVLPQVMDYRLLLRILKLYVTDVFEYSLAQSIYKGNICIFSRRLVSDLVEAGYVCIGRGVLMTIIECLK